MLYNFFFAQFQVNFQIPIRKFLLNKIQMGEGHSQPEILNLESAQQNKFQYRVAVICGSLRKASTNAGLLKAIYEAKDTRFFFEWIQTSQFPVFNEDIEAQGYPAPVLHAREKVGKCNAILFAIPEYNGTISSPLKNAYDWLSRQDKSKFCPVAEKLGAMVSSAAATGGLKAQDHFRQCVEYRKMNLLKPSKQAEIFVKIFSGKFFDANGNVIDADLKKRLGVFLNEFYNFIKANKK